MVTETTHTTAADVAAATRVLASLTLAEVDGSLAADARRVLGAEADGLRAAIASNRHDHPRRHGDREALAAVVAEARRVAGMWGVKV